MANPQGAVNEDNLNCTIYLIPFKKIGCTNDIKRRMRQYPKGTEFEILEELFGVDETIAGDREWLWADKLGYPRGTHYCNRWHTDNPGVKGVTFGSWWNNGITHLRSLHSPGKEWIEGRMYSARNAKARCGTKWWNDGKNEKYAREQPAGWVRGRLNQHRDAASRFIAKE